MPFDVGIRSGTAPKRRKVRRKSTGVAKAVLGVSRGTTRGAKRVAPRPKPRRAARRAPRGAVERAATGAARQTTKGAKRVRRAANRPKGLVPEFDRRFRYSMLDRLDRKTGRVKVPSEARNRRIDRQLAKFRKDVATGKLDVSYRIDRPSAARSLQKVERVGGVPTVVIESPQAKKRSHQTALEEVSRKRAKRSNVVVAPVLKGLEQTTRPIHAIAGGAEAAITGKNIPRAVSRGARLKDKRLFSDVLKAVGAPKAVQTVGGFALDVATDPLTWSSGGTAVPARIAARQAAKAEAKRLAKKVVAKPVSPSKGVVQKAGKRAYRRALKQGKPVKEARVVGQRVAQARQVSEGERVAQRTITRRARRAGKRAAKGMPETQGLTLRVGPLQTTGKTTARVAQKVRRKKPERRQLLRQLGSEFSPNVRLPGESVAGHAARKGAERESRAHAVRGRFYAMQKGRSLIGKIPEQDYPKVIDAIERGTVYTLPKQLQAPARKIEQAFRQARRAELHAGIETAHVSGPRYFAHTLESALEEGGKKGAKSKSGYTIRPGFTKERQFRGTMAKIEEAGGPEFTKNIPLVVAQRLAASAGATAKAKLNREVLKIGKRVTKGRNPGVGENEILAEVRGAKLKFVDDKAEAQQLIAKAVEGKASKGAEYVVVNRALKTRLRGGAPTEEFHAAERGVDVVTGGFKRVATATPGFHARNLIGDLQNAYLGQNLPGLLMNVGRSAKALHQLSKREKAALGEKVKRGSGTLAVKDELGRPQQLTLNQLVRDAERDGAIRTGYTGTELRELMGTGETQVAKLGKTRGKAGQAGRAVKRVMQNREDLIRLATYFGGRRQGLAGREAAQLSMKHHFDYADLSPIERRLMRRAFPFYTFTSRNISLQAKTLITKPGKYANIEKVRENVAKAQGIDLDEWEENLKEFQARAVPVPIKIGGRIYTVSTGGLPAQDINEFWQSNPIDFGDEAIKKALSMANPIIKNPVELWANYTAFFRSTIQRKESPLVAAPKFVGSFPAALKKKLGIVPDYHDRRTGKRGWGWPAKVDYVSKVVPGGPNFALQLATGVQSQRGQSTGGKLLSFAGGIKADAPDPYGAKIERLFKELDRTDEQIGKFKQRHKDAERKKANRKKYAIQAEITKLSKKRGDKAPLFQPRKVKRKSSSSGGWGGGGEGGW
jgi:hypothetical protein